MKRDFSCLGSFSMRKRKDDTYLAALVPFVTNPGLHGIQPVLSLTVGHSPVGHPSHCSIEDQCRKIVERKIHETHCHRCQRTFLLDIPDIQLWSRSDRVHVTNIYKLCFVSHVNKSPESIHSPYIHVNDTIKSVRKKRGRPYIVLFLFARRCQYFLQFSSVRLLAPFALNHPYAKNKQLIAIHFQYKNSRHFLAQKGSALGFGREIWILKV